MIIIDTRESSQTQQMALEHWKENGKVDTLPVADFADLDIGLGIEHKTAGDFYGSILSGRIFEQARQMGENYKYSYVIITGDPFEPGYSVPNPNVILGAITSLSARYPCKVIVVWDKTGMFTAIDMLVKKHSDGNIDKHTISRLQVKNEDIRLAMLATIPRLGIDKAKALLQKYEGNFVRLFEAPVSEYQTIPGIGPVLANRIKEVGINEHKTDPGEPIEQVKEPVQKEEFIL